MQVFFIPFEQTQNLCCLRCSCCCHHCYYPHFSLPRLLLHPHPGHHHRLLKVGKFCSTFTKFNIYWKEKVISFLWEFCKSTKISISGFYIEIVNIEWHSWANQHPVTVSIILFHVIPPRYYINIRENHFKARLVPPSWPIFQTLPDFVWEVWAGHSVGRINI